MGCCLPVNRFKGEQVDFVKWFSRQFHVVKSSVQTVSELNDFLGESERLAQNSSLSGLDEERCLGKSTIQNPYIDAVIVSHEFTDHCNRGTLLELDPDTPIFANNTAANTIRAWNYFSSVTDIPEVSRTAPDWSMFTAKPLPTWLSVFRITQSLDLTRTHTATVVCFGRQDEHHESFSSESSGDGSAEAVIYSPHGLPPANLDILLRASPRIHPLVLIHGMHEVCVGWLGKINLGAINGLGCLSKCAARYWVTTHDEMKYGEGLIKYLLRCRKLTLEDAFRSLNETTEKQPAIDADEVQRMKGFKFVTLGSGESLTLE